MLFVFGDASTQLFRVYQEGARGLDDVVIEDLGAFETFLANTEHDVRPKQEASLLLMGCNAGIFSRF